VLLWRVSGEFNGRSMGGMCISKGDAMVLNHVPSDNTVILILILSAW